MRKRAPQIEWHIAENDAEWAALRAHSIPDVTLPGKRRHFYWAALIALLLSVSGAVWLRVGKPGAPIPVEQADSPQVVTPGATSPAPQPVGLHTQPRPLPERRDFFDGDVARMLNHPEWGLQVYQQTTSGQLRAALDRALWGLARRLETEHFIFAFRQRDDQVVAVVAPRLEQLYTTLQQNFGLMVEPNVPKLLISLSQKRVVDDAPYRPRLWPQITAPSPALYPPTAWTEVDLLMQSLTLPLIDHVLARVVARYAIGEARNPMLAGLRLWQLWDLQLPLARGRTDLVRWIYVDLPTATPGNTLPLPTTYAELCANYTLWMVHPAQLGIPLLCTNLDNSPWHFPRQLLRYPPRRLPWLNAAIFLDENVDAQGRTRAISHPGDTIALAALVDYAVATYGRERLPRFVASLGQHDAWETLTPAVFGVAAPNFEAGWQRSLAQEQAAIDPAHP